MSDSRTTELLREGLTKRGIEWCSGLEGVTFVGDWCFVEYENGKLAATCEPVLTPEQAIAATLGNGTLTAEQVQKVIYKHGINDGFVYSVLKGSFQAIADELNAELGSEREKALEELVRDLFDRGKYFNPERYGIKALTKRAWNLGIEVNL